MIRLLSTLFVLTLAGTTNAQDGNSIVDINKLFELKVDSIEQKVTINKWGTDTSYYLHFQVENITIDTLTFKTNTCFYYNHSTLTVGNLEFDLNPKGGCLFNSHNEYELAPNESFDEAQSITAFKLNKLENMLLPSDSDLGTFIGRFCMGITQLSPTITNHKLILTVS